jgi:hypothetical protein
MERKAIYQGKIFTLFYVPMNFSSAMKRIDKKVIDECAIVPDYFCLSDHTSKWNMVLYLAVDKKNPDAENATLTGKFYCKVYKGPIRDTEKWMKDYKTHQIERFKD